MITYVDVVAAVRSGRAHRFETPDEVKAVVAAADRGNVRTVQKHPTHGCLVVHNGIESGLDLIPDGPSVRGTQVVGNYPFHRRRIPADDGLPSDTEPPH